jgi:Cu-Zn family superoxide dismutase
MKRIILAGAVLISAQCAVINAASAEALTVTAHAVSSDGVGASMGTVSFKDTADGLEIKTALSGLSSGEHGFHIHENPSCAPQEKDGAMVAALAAGPHFDPFKTGKHAGPHGGGHKGDLPKLVADAQGRASGVFVVKGLHLSEIRERSLMIHAGGDTYSDSPAPLGGGGARIGCAVIR